MATANEVIKQAQSWLGCKESNGTHKPIVDIYNAHKPLALGYRATYKDNWCAIFVSSCAIKCNATNIIPTECGCQRMIELFKNINSWQENESVTPEKGWVIFYDWQDNGIGDNKGWSDHVGIVEKVSNGNITVIEGNKGDSVSRRVIKADAKTIRGYGVPKYDNELTTVTKNYLSKGDEGNNVKVMQTMLTTCGYSCGRYGTDGDFGKDTDGALRKFQKDYGLVVDGKYGVKSKTRLENVYKGATQVSYYKRYNGKSKSIDTIFSDVGVQPQYRGGWKKRKAVASANGISNYTGTSSQNIQLIDYAKRGILKTV